MADSQRSNLMSRLLEAPYGVLLVGHGTRDAQGQAEFFQAGEMLQTRLGEVPVQACFLELAWPDIAAGVDALAKAGVRRIIAAPLLLFAAGHAKQDIPTATAAAATRHDGLAWTMAQPLGDHPALLALSAECFAETSSGDRETTWLFVGRGGSDPQAIHSVHAFAEQRRRLTPVAAHQVCFLAAAQPTLGDAIHWAVAQPPKHIVVQPHLLFHGQLMEDIAARIEAARERTGERKTWSIARHLGPANEVIDAALDRIREAATGGRAWSD